MPLGLLSYETNINNLCDTCKLTELRQNILWTQLYYTYNNKSILRSAEDSKVLDKCTGICIL